MTALLAIVFAAALSSSDIGEFFDLPSWLPTSVSSANTPGSDPSAGGGWYVDEYTNGMSYAWKIESPQCSNFEVSKEKLYYFDDLHGGWSASEVVKEIFDKMGAEGVFEFAIPPFIGGSPDDESVAFDGDAVTTMMNTRHVEFNARRDWRTVPIPTGRRLPRAARLTPDVQSGVLSTFAAYCERTYHAAQGQSNVWDTTIYGPRNDKQDFWFDPLTNGIEFVFCPTNREITTRRLVLYDNIDGLADYMLGDLAKYCFPGWFTDRPGWHRHGLGNYQRVWWSTTDTHFLAANKPVIPPFDWKRDPTVGVDWSTTAQTLRLFQVVDGVWYRNIWHQGEVAPYATPPWYYTSDPWGFAAGGSASDDGMRFDGQPFERWFVPDPLTNSIPELLVAAYPHGDPVAITNDTRRLLSDRLCCMNQMLGLMDRTYARPAVDYSRAGTNITYRNETYFTGSASVDYEFDPGPQRWNIRLTSSISWTHDSTNSSVEAMSVGSGQSAIHFRVHPTHTTTSVSAGLAPECRVMANDRIFKRCAAGHGSVGRRYLCYMYPTLSGFSPEDGTPYLDTGGWCLDDPGDCWIDSHTVGEQTPYFYTIEVLFGYRRHYTHERSLPPQFGVTQPGDFTRTSANAYGALLGYHRRSDDLIGLTGLTPIGYDEDESFIRYKSASGSYSSRWQLDTVLANIYTDFETIFKNAYGMNPDNPAAVIPIDAADVSRCRASVVLENVTIIAAPMNSVRVTYTKTGEDEYDIESVEHRGYNETEEESWHPDWAPLFEYGIGTGYTATNLPPAQVERAPLAMDAKIGVITRTDWNWNTLKRTDD